MLLMVAERIRGGMCQAICRHAKANNKYMKNCDKTLSQFVSMGYVSKIACNWF